MVRDREQMSDVYLSPTEVARKLGVTPKALRLYERVGLLSPRRCQNGWRVYGAVEMSRLHQVLALKGLGFSLTQIAELLSSRFETLDAVLDVQERYLEHQHTRLANALALVRRARTRLAAGETLSVDDLANLTTEATMTVSRETMQEIFKPLIEKHFTPAELEEIGARRDAYPDSNADWQALMAEAKDLMRTVDPASPQAVAFARRWKTMMDAFTGGDLALALKIKTVWQDAFRDPAAAPKLPASPELFAFVGEAMKNLGKAG
jgi:DNA-binding transcriptional MerR regulator